jgi:hypothetical protein
MTAWREVLPRGNGPAVGVEQHVEQAYQAGMVHADDPFTPRQILDRVSLAGPLPVQDRGDIQSCRIEKDIVGP